MLDADRDFLLEQLAESKREILDAIDSGREGQAGLKGGPNRWSVLECLEHVVVAENLMLGLIEPGYTFYTPLGVD